MDEMTERIMMTTTMVTDGDDWLFGAVLTKVCSRVAYLQRDATLMVGDGGRVVVVGT